MLISGIGTGCGGKDAGNADYVGALNLVGRVVKDSFVPLIKEVT